MTAEVIKELLHATPFLPFSIYLPDRPPMRVPHPDFAHIAPDGRVMLVYSKDGKQFSWIDVALITQAEPETKPRR
jgi:hypothetical protein